MRSLLTICVVGMILTIGATANADITTRAEYIPSSDIRFTISGGQLLGSPAHQGPPGNTVPPTGAFHINVLHQDPPWTDAQIDYFNDRGITVGNPGGYAFGDTEAYWLDLTTDGTSSIDYAGSPTGTFADWTITGTWGTWSHTIMTGDFVDKDSSGGVSDGDYLKLDPQAYRTFPPSANPFEGVFAGALLTSEVLGYTYTDIGGGVGNLAINVVPVPGAFLARHARLEFGWREIA